VAGKNKHAHHGGAWKVAYADFVTAMMALFLVLWLSSQDQKIKEAIQRSFNTPPRPLSTGASGILPTKEKEDASSKGAAELNLLRRLAQDLTHPNPGSPDTPDDETFKMELLPDGMRVNMFDRSRRPIFARDTAELTKYGEFVVSTLAWNLARLKGSFQVEVEGHTEAGHPPKSEEYSNWELSVDRANTARRKLLEHGVPPGQIRQVSGHADVAPMRDLDPTDEANRRVTVMLKIKPNRQPN
jgi:chemotaxis protein MotB